MPSGSYTLGHTNVVADVRIAQSWSRCRNSSIHDAVPARLEVTHETFDLGHDLRRVGGAGTEDDLHLGRKLGGGSEEVGPSAA
jgi:hypothetical protein